MCCYDYGEVTAMGKMHSSVGACGLGCVLCPRYYTEGKSKCDGCGSAYSYAAVGCKFFRCCVKGKNFETCAECNDFPCSTFEGADEYDSFLTHRKMISNLRFIKTFGIKKFLNEQEKRQRLLKQMLEQFNEGRSRSLYCVAATLIPIESVKNALNHAKKNVKERGVKDYDLRGKAKILKKILNEIASKETINLNLRNHLVESNKRNKLRH